MAVEPDAPQAELGEDVGEADGTTTGAEREDVRDLASEATVPPAHLSVGDDRAAEPFTEVEIGEVVESPGRAARSARAAQLTSLSTLTGPATNGARTSTGSSSPTQERRVRQVDQAPGGAVDGIGGADHGQPDRPGARGAAPARGAGAPCRRRPAGGPGERQLGATTTARGRRRSRPRRPPGRCSTTSAVPSSSARA